MKLYLHKIPCCYQRLGIVTICTIGENSTNHDYKLKNIVHSLLFCVLIWWSNWKYKSKLIFLPTFKLCIYADSVSKHRGLMGFIKENINKIQKGDTWQKFSISLFIQSNWFFLKVIKGFSSHWRIFHLYGDFAITVEGLDLYSWPLSSKGCLTYYIYCDTGQPFIVVISKDPWNTPFAERLAVEQSLPVLTT